MKNESLDHRLSRLYAAEVPEGFGSAWRADIRREESIQNMKNTNRFNQALKRFAPALCALVLAAGGLWTGTLENAAPQTNQKTAGAVYSMRTTADTAANSYYDTEASYDYGTVQTTNTLTTYGAQQQTDRKLVRTADLTLRTDSYDDAVTAVQTTIAEMGGYIESLHQYGDEQRYLNLSLRVPSEKLDAFLNGMAEVGKVTNRSESTTDMTVEYADNEARLATLYQKRDRLNDLLAQAQNVSDLIEIESAIADTQYQIDRYETTQRSIDRQVDMSMVSLTIAEEKQTVVNAELTLAQRISAGFRASVKWLGNFGRNVIVFAVMIAPAAAAAAVLWLGWKLIRRIKRNRNKEE